ncbi:hypothetical protein NDU88_001721, partial [Pleurodeles waltl]
LHSCYKTSIRPILLQKRHLASQSQVVQHTAGPDDLTHLLQSTRGLYTGGCTISSPAPVDVPCGGER